MDDLGENFDMLMRGVYLVALLAVVMFGVRWRGGSLSKGLQNAAIWLGLILALMIGYSYRTELNHDGTVRIARTEDGHFSALAMVNGRPLAFLIDTGASSVVLPFKEAIRLGFKSGELHFIRKVQTANGTAFEAPILIDRLEVEGIVMEKVGAAVAEPGNLSTPLLGMSFLNRLQSYSFEGAALTLKQ